MAKLKLKQASAVLQVPPKELQNLIQFGVVKPKRSEGTYFFDTNMLLVAKIALYVKESLGARTSVLSRLMDVFSAAEDRLKAENPSYVVFSCRPGAGDEPIKLSVPLRALEEQIQDRMSRADLYKDLPRGRKRRLEEGVPGISKGSGKGYRRSVRRRNLANSERLSQRETHAGDYRCRQKLAGASRVSLLT
jgi:hypothetical protein